MQWLRYFLGTPQRLMRTLAVLSLITVVVRPELLQTALTRLVGEVLTSVSPLIGPVLTILVVFAGIRMVLYGRR